MRTIFFCTVYPHLTYGIEIWGFSSKTYINKLNSAMNQCIKLLRGKMSIDTEDYRLLNILRLRELVNYFCYLRFFKYYSLETNPYFRLKFLNQLPHHNHATRLRIHSSFNTPRIVLSRSYRSFFYQALKLYAKLPSEARSITSFDKFKNYIKPFCAQSYS